jgi:hypothetical protein
MVWSLLFIWKAFRSMNERIKLLAEQAESSRLEYNSATMMTERIQEFDKQKFAELIVQECVTVMYDDAIERKVPPDINQTPTHYAVAVLEHFGVKE